MPSNETLFRRYRLPIKVADAIDAIAARNKRTPPTELTIAAENHIAANQPKKAKK